MTVPAITARGLIAATAAVAPVLACGAEATDRGRHQAHVHGVAELTLALEGPILEIEFTSPAVSAIGFEHRAENPEQVEAIAEAKAILRDGIRLFTFMGTACTLTEAVVDMSAVVESATDVGAAGNDHESDGHEHNGYGAHTDISSHYRYNCTDTSALKTLWVGTDALPFGLETINVMWVSDHGQGATVLTTDSQLIELN